MATDIAFAMGVYTFFKHRMPAGMAAFLLTLATVDDLGAIAVIALCYAGHIAVPFLAGASACCVALAALHRRKLHGKGVTAKRMTIFAALGVALWCGIYLLLRFKLAAREGACVERRSSAGSQLPPLWISLSNTLLTALSGAHTVHSQQWVILCFTLFPHLLAILVTPRLQARVAVVCVRRPPAFTSASNLDRSSYDSVPSRGYAAGTACCAEASTLTWQGC